MFQDIIEILLEKKANLNADKEAKFNQLLAELDAEFAKREETINNMLNEAGYIAPVEEEVVAEVVTEEVAEVETTQEEDWR